MKRLLAIVAISAFASCRGGDNDSSKVVNGTSDQGTMPIDGGGNTANTGAINTPDSLKRASDSARQTGDTSALNSSRGDSTSASGNHGQGSGSRVGGGKTGAPQNKKGQK